MHATITRCSRASGTSLLLSLLHVQHEKAVGEAVDLIVTILYSLSRVVLVSTCTEPGRMRQVVVYKRVKGLLSGKILVF